MKRLTIFFSVLTFVLFSSFAHAALQFDAEVQPALKKQILADFDFMKSIQASQTSALHKNIFGAVDGKNYFNWFNKRVFSVGLDDCGSATAVACVIVMYSNKIWMTPNYSKFSHPQISRLSVIYHEARHTEEENGNWSHANCPTPFKDEQGHDMKSIWTGALLQGKPACDSTAFGSYGSATILLMNIANHCESCSEKTKADAELYGKDQLGRIIDPKVKKKMIQDLSLPL
jgi:hypothetical protein